MIPGLGSIVLGLFIVACAGFVVWPEIAKRRRSRAIQHRNAELLALFERVGARERAAFLNSLERVAGKTIPLLTEEQMNELDRR